MTLPNFLGIGARRSGTTWLDMLLRSHPDIYLPNQRKEIHFFDNQYNRGLDWYKRFFPSLEDSFKFKSVGEITPSYLSNPNASIRIREHISNCRFVAILRNPVDRLYSEYGYAIVNYNEKKSFVDYVDHNPHEFTRGLYSEQLKRYLQYFPLQNFLILIFERAVKDTADTRRRLANFLSVEATRFGHWDATRKVNSSYRVRFARCSALAYHAARYLRRKDLNWVVNMANALDIKRLFGSRGGLPQMDKKIRAELLSRFEADISELEGLLGEDLSIWRIL
jgi:hypothetical protein